MKKLISPRPPACPARRSAPRRGPAPLVVAGSLALLAAPAFAQDPAGTDPAAPTAAPAPVDAPTPADATPPPPPVAPAPPVSDVPRLSVPLPPPPPPEDDLPIPTLTIDRIPPNTSYEFAVSASFGEVAYFQEEVPPWIGFGIRGGWGKNLGLHRIGVAGVVTAEGDIGVHTQIGVQPELTWDFVSSKGLLLGAGAGPAMIWTAETSTIEPAYGMYIAPTVSGRVGWSQTWSRVGRRLFLFLEPRARLVGGSLSPTLAVAVGSGAGR